MRLPTSRFFRAEGASRALTILLCNCLISSCDRASSPQLGHGILAEGLQPPRGAPPDIPIPSARPEDSLPQSRIVNKFTLRSEFPDGREPTKDSLESDLKEIEQALVANPKEPRLWWCRWQSLVPLGRGVEGRESQAKAIRLAKEQPEFRVLLPNFYLEQAREFARDGDVAHAAVYFLEAFQESPRVASSYRRVAHGLSKSTASPSARHIARGPSKSTASPSALDARTAELERLWGPLADFFQRYQAADTLDELRRRSRKILPGTGYQEAARILGFPSFESSERRANHPDRTYWIYDLDRRIVDRPAGGPLVSYRAEQGPAELRIQIEGDTISSVNLNLLDNK